MQSRLPPFYDFDEYEWLVEAAGKIGPRLHLLVLLGGEAGLRRGEVIALERTDCDLRRGRISVRRSEWNGQVTATKGRSEWSMTQRLLGALRANDHLAGDRCLHSGTMPKVTAKVIRKWMQQVQRRARLKATGGYHILRHTFCSHLAMRGVPVMSIRKLAGHKELKTTLRYVHISGGETERAIDAGGDHSVAQRV